MDTNSTNQYSSQKQVIIYTDGACSNNPGPGGWGVVLKSDSYQKMLKGGALETTNNQMELIAAIKALKALKYPCKVILYTDSVYVQNGITKWLENWKKKNWRTASKKAVKNKKLWQTLDQLNQKHTVIWKWVKGHSGNEGNELADQLAREGMKYIVEQQK